MKICFQDDDDDDDNDDNDDDSIVLNLTVFFLFLQTERL